MSQEYNSTGTLRIPGLGYDGVEWDDMIDKLFQVERTKFDRLEKWKSDWNERKKAFETIKTELVTLQQELQKLNTVNKFLVKSATSSSSGVATATLGANALKGSYNIEVGRVATKATWSKETGIRDKFTSINDTGSLQYFKYKFQGTEYSVEIPPNTTLEGMKNLINSHPVTSKHISASLVNGGNGYILQLDTKATGANNTLEITDSGGLKGLDLMQSSWEESDTYTSATMSRWLYNSPTEVINASGGTQRFFWTETVGGATNTYGVNVPDGTTLEGLRDLINGHPLATTTATLHGDAVNGFQLGLTLTDPGDTIRVDTTQTTVSGLPDMSAWQSRQGQNAQYRINNWPAEPNWYESATNEIVDEENGITFNIKGEGKSTISVDIDTEKITENVQAFVDAVNKVRSTFIELTKFDSDKETVTPEYAESQFEMQKGSVLTGNYGVQMIESRLKQIIAASGTGFLSLVCDGDPNGDIFNSLSQIGITTNSDESSDNYGLLEIRRTARDESTKWNASNLEDALKKDPEAVAMLFAASNQDGRTRQTPGFSFNRRSADTKNGTYDVKYTSDGTSITGATINGEAAVYNPANKTLTYAGPSPNPAEGLVLNMNDLTAGTYSGSIIVNGTENEVGYAGKPNEKTYCMSSSSFTFSGAAPQTKPGTYDVRYDVDAAGNVTNATINGKAAVYQDGVLKMADITDPDAANGIELVINSLSAGSHMGQVSIRQGKVNELLNALRGDGTQENPGMLDSEHGTLAILISNYKDIMDGATKKMEQEAERLNRWRDNMIKKFSRLEAVLAEYSKINAGLESQIKQLGTSSK